MTSDPCACSTVPADNSTSEPVSSVLTDCLRVVISNSATITLARDGYEFGQRALMTTLAWPLHQTLSALAALDPDAAQRVLEGAAADNAFGRSYLTASDAARHLGHDPDQWVTDAQRRATGSTTL